MSRPINHPNLPQLLLKARESVFSHFRPIISHFGLTEQQWRVLRTVSEHQQLEPREICDRCQILSSSMAGVLARMEDMGLIERSRFPDDQRRVLVRPAAKGEQIVQKMAPLIETQYAHLEQALGKKLFKETYSLLERLIDTERKVTVQHVELPPRSPAEI